MIISVLHVHFKIQFHNNLWKTHSSVIPHTPPCYSHSSFLCWFSLLLSILPLTICRIITIHLKTPVAWINISVCFILLKSFYTVAGQQSHISTVTCFSVAKGNTTDGKNWLLCITCYTHRRMMV